MREIVVSTLVFLFCLGTLTALRVWRLEPATPVQSAIVNGTALLTVVAVAYYVSQDGDFIGGWILAFSPSLAFTVNLFVPVVAEVTPFVVVAPLGSAAAISSIIAVIGYTVGHGISMFRGTERLPDSS